MRTVHVVVPGGLDDPARPSGGNTYDRRVCAGLAAANWQVHEHPVPGTWPAPDIAATEQLAAVVRGLPDGALLLVDGLIASAAAGVLVAATRRLRLVVLMHMPLGGPDRRQPDEAAVLSAADGVITTSGWTRERLLDWYRLDPQRVEAASPGVEPAALAPGSSSGRELLSVAAVTAHKGHDVLVAALLAIADLSWRCRCVGSLDREPEFAAAVRDQAAAAGLADRVRFLGPRTGPDLDGCYAASDLLVLASRGETYGMVVVEALARGIPVVASAVGGLPEALGTTSAGPPGLLVPAGDPAALAGALRRWLGDAELRGRLRAAAEQRRGTLPGWAATAERVAAALMIAAGRRR